jgi:HEAT repeat protein
MNAIVITCLAAFLSAPPQASVDHDEFRASARQYLRDYGVASDSASLLKALTTDPRPTVRILAADLLASLQARSAVPVMRSALESESDEKVRSHLGKDLLDLEGDQAHTLISALFTRTRELDNRIYLAGPLAELKDFSGYPDVLAGLKSQNLATQMFAAYALGSFLAKCRGCGLVPSPVDEALESLKIATARPHVVIALSHRLDDPRVVAALEAVAATDHDDFVKHIAKVFLEQAAREKQKNHAD